MSSREIADLVGPRHDKVKQSIERLAERGVISLPPLGEVKIQRERRVETITVYKLCKRDSLIVVAQLCPEFTARIVDRWQELEEKAASPMHMIPRTLPEALKKICSGLSASFKKVPIGRVFSRLEKWVSATSLL